MSNLNYRNPKTPLTAVGGLSLPLEKTDGVTFSVLNSGGYMEVYNLDDLIYQIPTGVIGPVLFSGNTIPVQLNKGTGTVFSPDVLTLSSDNITSGRRRLGMLVFVQEEKQVYQFRIDNYDSLWSAATGSTGPGGPTVVFSQFGTTVKNNTASGQNFINAWTGSTIEGYSGGTRSNSNWIKYYGTDLAVTGGSFSNITNVLTLTNITGGTIPITGFTSFDRAISAFTYDNANTFIIDDNSGNTYTATIDIVTGLTVNGDLNVSGNTNLDGITQIYSSTYQTSPILSVTGTSIDFDFNAMDFTGNLNVYGPLVVTGNTTLNGLTATTISATTYQNLPVTADTFVTGFTYTNNTFSLLRNQGQPNLTATINTMTGLTVNGNLSVTGNTNVSGLSATTISATTYQNLPVTFDRFVTGFTYSPNTFTITDNSGSTFNAVINTVSGLTVNGNLSVTGNTNVSGLSATTISATTYQNLPITFDRFITGFTYSPNTFTISDNSGSTFNATIDIVSGLTVNGNLSVTGDTTVDGLTATTISATTYQNLPITFDRFITGFTYSPNTFTISDNSGSTFNATIDIVSGLTVNGDLSVTGNTIVNGLSATTISATTYQNLPIDPDIFVTGFTYSPNTFTISDNSGSTFNATINTMSGLTINGDLSVSGDTNLDGPVTINITSSTIPSGTSTSILSITGSSIDIDFDLLEIDGDLQVSGNTILSGVTASTLNVTGDTIVNGLTATTISATTYQNLPIDPDTYITGFTYSPNTFTISDNSGSTFDATIDIVSGLTVNGDLSVTGDTTVDGLTATTISATTYQNLPIDPDTYITGFTYSPNTFTISDNSGSTFNATINTMSGLTINGNLSVTGNTNVSGLSATTISATTYQNLPVTADTFVTGFTYLNNTFSILRNQGQPNLTATINTMTGLTVNGNLTVTGNTSVQGITGTSAVFSANSQNIVTIFGSGSTQPIFVIQGSSGQLFSVTDSLVGSLFSVNDISGLPILEVFSDNTILMGSYLAPSLNTTTKISLSAGTNNIYSIPTSAYTGAFIEYTLSDTTNARSGTMMAVFSGSSVQFNETTTLDIGNTSSVTMSFVISGGNCILRATSVSSGYSIKVIIRTI